MKLDHLPETLTVHNLTNLFQITETNLYKLTNAPHHYYHSFPIPKRSGGTRKIEAPTPLLKRIQLIILQHFLEPRPVSRFAKAYKKGSTLKDMARFHIDQPFILRIDLTDFFGSLQESAIFRLFRQLGYSEAVTVILTKLTTLRGALPQGAPTSPALSNLLMKEIDERIGRYCIENKIRYTRYADDLIFSGDFSIKKLLATLFETLKPLHLKVNSEKTRVMRKHTKQVVTGIVVNKKLNVSRAYKRKLRQELYYVKKYGVERHLGAIRSTMTAEKYLAHLEGKKNFIHHIVT